MLVVIFLVESMHIVEKYLFKLIIDNGTAFSADLMTRAAFIDSLILIGYVFVGLVAMNIILYFSRPTLVNLLEVNVIADMKRRLFKHILHLDHNFHTTHKTGSLISRLVKGSGAMERMTDLLAYNVFPLIVQIIVIGFTMAYIDSTVLAIMLGTAVVHISYSFTFKDYKSHQA